MTAIPSTVVVPRADEPGAPRRLRSKGVNWGLTGVIFLDFSSTIPDTSSFIVRMGNFGCFLSESQGESRQAVRSITSGREEMMIMQTCSAISAWAI
jgi:hypothetical protein